MKQDHSPIIDQSDDEYYYVKCQIQNITKIQMQSTTASMIYEKVQIALNQILPDNQICIYQVEFKFEQWNQNDAQIQGDTNYNNYGKVAFLEILLKDQLNELNESSQSEFNQQSSSFDSQNRLDKIIQDSSELSKKQLDNLNQYLSELFICEPALQFEDQPKNQQEIDQKQYNKILITFYLTKGCLMKLEHQYIKIFPNSDLTTLDFKQAEILYQNNENQNKFTKFIQITDLNFFYINAEDLKGLSLDIPKNRPIKLFLSPYYQYQFLNSLHLETYLMYENIQNQQEDESIIIIINIIGKLKLRIQIPLNSCQYCHYINNEYTTHLYFKLNHPPLFSAALFDKYKINLLDDQIEWIRIENIHLNSYFLKHKNILEKYIILNNTIIEIQIKNIIQSGDIIFLNQLLLRLKQIKLLYDNEIQLNIVKNSVRDSRYDILFQQLDQSALSFQQKYNFICIISQNRIIDCHHLKSLLNYIKKHQLNLNIQQNDQIFDAIFQSFMRFSQNLSNSVRISDKNNRNFLIFKRDLQNQIQQEINLKRPLMVKQVRLTPSGYVPMISYPEKPKLLIKLFKDQNFIKLSLRDDNGKLIRKCNSKFRQFYKLNLIEDFILFKERFKLLGWNNKESKQHIVWMNRISDKEQNHFLLTDFYQDCTILEQVENKFKFNNFFIDGQNIQFKQLKITPQINQNNTSFGQISRNLVCKIREILNNNEVSAIQIVYNGIQYVLLLNNTLDDNTIQLNQQLQQFSNLNDVISIIDYNKYREGYLNRELIRILNQIGIKQHIFIQLLNWHLEQISISKKVRCVSVNSELCEVQSIIDILNLMKSNNLNEENCLFIKKVEEKLKMLEIQQLKKQHNILVEKAQILFGVIDYQGILNEGEVICIRKSNDQIEYLEGQLIVIKDNIQSQYMILQVIGLSSKEITRRFGNKQIYDEYINCIIFSNTQQISTPFYGNTYFVSWDKRLIQNKQGVINKKQVLNSFDFLQFEKEEFIDNLFDILNNQITLYQNLENDESIFDIIDQFIKVNLQNNQIINQINVNIDDRFIYRFYWLKEKNNYEKYVQQYLEEYHFIKALKCLNYIVDTFNAWMQLYDIKDEYEIYSGYYESKKDDENFESFQELMMLNLGQLKIEVYNILSQNQQDRQIQIWIIHFLIIYLPNEITIGNQQLERIIKCIYNQVQKFNDCYKLCSRLKNKSLQWFKGCSWYFFRKEILDFELSSKNE